MLCLLQFDELTALGLFPGTVVDIGDTILADGNFFDVELLEAARFGLSLSYGGLFLPHLTLSHSIVELDGLLN